MDTMGASKPPKPPQLVGGVLRTGRLPDNLVGALLARFRVTGEEGGGLYSEIRSGIGIYTLLWNLDSKVDPAPGMEHLALLGVDRDGRVHVLHSFFSIPVGRYSTERRLLDFSGDLSPEGIPTVTDPPVYAFAVQRIIFTVPREDQLVHIEGTPPSIWKMKPCKREGKQTEDSKYLSCRGLTCLPSDGTSCLLGQDTNIAEASVLIYPLQSIRALLYDKALDWIQFSYTGDRFGANVAPAST